MAERAEPPTPSHGVSFREAARFWVKLGFINFGGPTGQIAIMYEEIVERRRWITNGRFLHALNYCMVLPGPEAQQLAIYVGWLLHEVRGGLVAGITFILPSFFVMLGLSWLYVTHGDVTWVSAILSGLSAAVIGIVVAATIRVARKALANGLMAGVAAAAFISIFLLHVPFPVIVLGALAVGLVGGRLAPQLFDVGVGRELEENERVAIRDDVPGGPHTRPSSARTLVVLVVGLAVWLIPIAAVAAWRGPGDTVTEMGWFFSKAAHGDVRRRLRGARLRERRGGRAVRMAAARADGGGTGAGRDDARPTHHGPRVRGLRRGVSEPRRPLAARGRRAGCGRRDVGHVRAVLPLDLPGRPLHRATPREPTVGGGARDRDRRGRRRDREPRA